ncbi:MAG: hypothetical protein E7321_00030 [Clostridiales bacterium]|nr:hypothetical protein [Clostridiales bacterium]
MARGSSARNSAKSFYSRSRQEDEEDKKVKAPEVEEPQPAAPEPAPVSDPKAEAVSKDVQMRQPEAVKFEKADDGLKVSMGPLRSPMTEDQHFLIHQRNYTRGVDVEVVKAGELYLPDTLEPHREQIEQKNREGGFIPSSVRDWGVNDISVNIASIKDEKQLAYFASTLDSDWDKVTVYKAWANKHNKNYDDVLYSAEQLLGDRLFSKPQSSMGILSGLVDVNGNAININTARPEMVTQGIQGIADKDDRAAAVKAFKSLCSRRGSRFFGYFPPDDIDTFRDSYSLTQTQYNSLAKEYKTLFKQGTGEEIDRFNAEQYHLQLASIQDNESYDVLAKRNLTSALEKAYFGVATHKDKLPDKPQEQPEAQGPQQEEEPKKDNRRWIEKVGDAIDNGLDAVGDAVQSVDEFLFGKTDAKPGDDAEPEAKGTADNEAPAQRPEESSPVKETEQESGETSSAPSNVPSVQLFTQTVLGDKDMPGMAQVQAQQDKPEYIPVADDGEVLELMYQGKGNLIAPEDRAHIDELMKDQNVRRLHGALNNQELVEMELGTNSPEFITDKSMRSFGTTIYGAYQDIMSDEFPRELRGDGMMILTEVVYAAGQAYAKGDLVCPEGENGFEYYLKNSDGHSKIQGIYNNWNLLIENENKIRAEEEQKSAKALEDARAAVLSGQYSDAQLALVQENATAEWKDVLDDELRAVMNFQLNRNYFEPVYGGFEQTSVYKNLSARGVKDTGSFIASIKSEMHALLDEDTETALSLGLSLEQYYDRIGGMNLDQLAQRANVRMQQQGASITPEEKETLIGMGEGVGVIPATGYGIARGAQNWWGTFNDSLYKGMTQANVVRTAEKLTGHYQTEFGPYGRDYYRDDLTALIDSGTLSEEYAKALKQAMDSATDIYDIGIDPTALGGLRSTAAQMRENVAQLDTFMAKNGTPGENRWYGFASAITENTISATVAGAGSALTGNAAAGFFLGYDVTSYGQNYDARLAQGYLLNSASHMAAWDTAAMHLANSGTFEKIYGQLTGATTLGRAGWFEAMSKNPSGSMKAKAAIKTFVTTAAGNVFDEAVSDELKENIAAQAVDQMFGPIYRKIDAGEDIGAADVVGAMLNVTDVDLVKAGRDVMIGLPDAAITSSLFTLAGASVTTITSVRMAKDIVGGKSKDIAGFIEAAKADMSNPETAAAINDDAHAQQMDEKVVHVLIRDDGSDGKIAQHQKLQEQADSHKQELDASTVRIEEGWKHYDEQKAAGNMQAAVNALDDISKAEQGQKEHAREEAQKTYEANQVREEKMQDARKAAAVKLAQEAEAKRTQLQNDNENRKRTLDAQIEEVESQLAGLEEQIAQADADDDIAAFDELSMKRSELEDRRLMLLGEAQESEATQDARNAAENALNAQDEQAAAALQEAAEKENLTQEKATMAPVYKDLRTRAIYVDAQQAAEIKSQTGLTIPQFNRKYGFNLTQDKTKSRNSLDGSFFADLAAQAPGYIDGETTHPEEAIVALAERKKQLAGVQASIGSAVAEAYITETTEGTLDPVTQKMASDLYKKTGIKLVTANLADGTRGWFDRANGQLVLSNKLGAGELRRVVVLHELTHFIEKSKGYEEYKQAVLEAAYAGDETATERDREDIREEYSKHGVTLSESELDAELVAAATETVIGGDEVFFEQLIESGKRSFVKRVYMKLRTFLNRQKAKKAGPEARAQYDAIQKAHDLMEQALRKSAKIKEGETGSDPTAAMSELTNDTDNRPVEQTQLQYSLVGRTDDGKGIYESNFAPDTPKSVKINRLVDLWQNVWSKDPIELDVIGMDGQSRKITANFDPDYDPTNQVKTDLGKVVHSKNGSSGDRTITLNLADDLHDMAREVTQVDNEAESGKVSPTHEGVKEWHYFSNDFVYRDENGDKPMTLWLDLKERDDGGWVYQLYARKTKEKKDAQLRSPDGSRGRSEATPSSNTSVPQSGTGVKNQSMQSSVQKSIGIRQFGNNTMQRADFIEDHVKELVKDSEYERDTNRDQVKRATERLDRDGLDATVAMLMNKEKKSYTADDNALAFVAMADATRNSDSVTAAMLAMRMLEESTEQGRALQSLKIGLRLTPEGAMAEAIRKAQQYNTKKKNTDATKYIPIGNEAPKGKPASGNAGGTTGNTSAGSGNGDGTGAAGQGSGTGGYSGSGSGNVGGNAAGSASKRNGGPSTAWTGNESAPEGSALQETFMDDTPLADEEFDGQILPENTTPGIAWTGEESAPDGAALQETMLDNKDGWLADEAFDGPQLAADADGVQESIGPGPVEDTGMIHFVPQYIQDIYDAADTLKNRLDKLDGETSRNNPWGLPLNAAQMELAKKYGLMSTALPSDYAHATLKQRMLSAIIATPEGVRGSGLLTLCQQLEFMKEGYAVVTEADLNYIAGQMSEVIAQGGVENDIPKTREGKIALSRVYDAQANITPASFMEKFRSWTYANMLSSPATWVRNVASNVLMNPLESLSTALGTLVDKAVSKQTGTRTTSIANKQERAQGKEAFKSEAAQTFEDYFITHTDTGHGRKYDINQAGRGRTFQNDMLEAGKTMVDFAMQIGDRPFYEKCYAEELAIIKRLGMKVNEGGVLREMTAEEMHEEATMRATKRVFQEDGTISKAIAQLQESPFWGTVANMVIPFVKTPTNIAARLLDYSPVGLAKSLIKDGLWDMKYNNGAGFDQRRFVMNVGRGLTGTGLVAAGCALASAGALKFGYGEEEDEKVRGVRKALGDPYGMYLEIGGKKHEIDWALPGAGGLVIGANLVKDLADATGNADVVEALTKGVLSSTWNEMFNSSMLSAFNDVFRGYGDATGIAERFIQTSANSLVNRLTPSWVRAVAKATDPYVRDTSDSNAIWASLKQNMVQSWPLLRQMLPIKTDITGDEQLQNGYWNPEGEHGNAVMQMLDSFLTPTATIGEKNDEALVELLDLAYRTGEGNFLPTDLIGANKSELKLNKTEAQAMHYGDAAIIMDLTDDEKRSVNAQHGDLLFNGDGGRPYRDAKSNDVDFPGLRLVMEDKARYGNQSKAWSKMDDDERTKLVKDMVDDAKLLIVTDMARRKREAGEI